MGYPNSFTHGKTVTAANRVSPIRAMLGTDREEIRGATIRSAKMRANIRKKT
jgi:hypothetical protein